VNNCRVGTVDSRVDRNEQGINLETYPGYQDQVFQKTTEDLNGFNTHEAMWQVLTIESQDKPSICVSLYAWSSFGGVISATFLHVTSSLSHVLEGHPRQLHGN
jgi:hypothetical protein